MSDESLKMAVFVDFDNIEIGVKTTLGGEFDVGAVLEAVKERGEVMTKGAYGDWEKAGDYSRKLTQHAVRMVQRNMTPGGDKNGADINLALDALEMALTHDHINGFVIVGGDSDFISLVEKLKQYDRKVFVVGGRQFTAVVLQKNCTEFIAYENLVRQSSKRQSGTKRGRSEPSSASSATTPVDKAFPLVTRALQVLTDREVTPQLGLLKSTLLQLDSAFSERDYGSSSFRDFAEKLAKAKLVTLRNSGRNILVELRDTDAAPEPAPAEASPASAPASAEADSDPRPKTPPDLQQGTELFQRVLATPGAIEKWPVYIRSIRQAMRAVDGSFDERRHGDLVDILKAAQRDGLVKLDRGRRGSIRIFPGPKLEQPSPPAEEPAEPVTTSDAEAPPAPDREKPAAEPEAQPVADEPETPADAEPMTEPTAEEPAAEEPVAQAEPVETPDEAQPVEAEPPSQETETPAIKVEAAPTEAPSEKEPPEPKPSPPEAEPPPAEEVVGPAEPPEEAEPAEPKPRRRKTGTAKAKTAATRKPRTRTSTAKTKAKKTTKTKTTAKKRTTSTARKRTPKKAE